MISFPIFDRLEVKNYGLYPGSKGSRDLQIVFQPGLTLILGANGLGKSTLVSILYRLLAGPFDIPGLTGRVDLGSINLQPTQLSSAARSVFSQRVADAAKQATAALQFKLGANTLLVERRLSDLSLVRFSVNGEELAKDETKSFQTNIVKLVGVWSFGDWILLLRHLVFYFEERRALVWDASAQRQILRLLLLPAETARKWTQDERAILELDSRARNLNAAAYREEQSLGETEEKVEHGADVRAELESLEGLQKIDISNRETLDSQLVESEAHRQSARLRLLKAEQEREARYRELERAKLTAIEARFPKKSETARYVLAQLMTDADCLVCGNHVPKVAAALERRITQEHCVVCGSDLKEAAHHVPANKVTVRRVEKFSAELAAIEPEVTEARSGLEVTENTHSNLVLQLAEFDKTIAERSLRIDFLIRKLPPAEAELHKQRAELASMRSRVEILRKELAERRKEFSAFVGSESRAMVKRSGNIARSFATYAEGFLFETCGLIWSPQSARVGQTGELIDFPAFELEMTGTDFPSPVRRSGPDQVSESQREFIDLAFRMSLIETTGTDNVGSLIIDAPESSLDAVFVVRAANVLARFALPNRGNRLVVTSNLVEGKLIPSLLKLSSSSGDRLSRLVDLFKIAEPTAAIRELKGEYAAILRRMITSLGGRKGGRASARKRKAS